MKREKNERHRDDFGRERKMRSHFSHSHCHDEKLRDELTQEQKGKK